MKKPLGISLLVGLLALAFAALPAMASANVTLSTAGGALASGDPVTAEGTDLVTTTEGGAGPTLECTKVEFTGEVGVNGAEPATLINGLGEGEGCHAGETPVNVEEIIVEKDELFQEHNGTVKADVAQFVFHYTIAGVVHCTFTGVNAPTMWAANGVITVGPAALTGTGAGCPANGSLTGHLTLTSAGEAVSIS